jgi:hypothetical protein
MLQSECAPETPFMGNAMPAVLRGRDGLSYLPEMLHYFVAICVNSCP